MVGVVAVVSAGRAGGPMGTGILRATTITSSSAATIVLAIVAVILAVCVAATRTAEGRVADSDQAGQEHYERRLGASRAGPRWAP